MKHESHTPSPKPTNYPQLAPLTTDLLHPPWAKLQSKDLNNLGMFHSVLF